MFALAKGLGFLAQAEQFRCHGVVPHGPPYITSDRPYERAA
jgi:hypothetical protein